MSKEKHPPLHRRQRLDCQWPPSANENLVLELLQKLVEYFTAWVTECGVLAAVSRQIYGRPGIYTGGSPIRRKMVVGVMARQQTDHGETHFNWAQTFVAGELKNYLIEDGRKRAWFDLAT